MKKKSASKSAFFKLRVLLGVLLCFAAIAFVVFAQPRSVQSGNSQPIFQVQYRGLSQVVKFDISPPLRDMKPLPWPQCTKSENEEQGPIPLGPVGPVVPGWGPLVAGMGAVGIVAGGLGAVAAQTPRLQFDTLRLRVIKIGAWIREAAHYGIASICLHLSSHHPGQALWLLLARASRVPTWSR